MHGGLRYLQQREFRLVYEALAERQIALAQRAAPRARAPVPRSRSSPATASSTVASPGCSAPRCGCTTSRVACASARSTSGSRRTTRSATCRRSARRNLAGGYLFYDAQTDDARLTLTIARTAAAHGAVVVNHASVAELRKDGDGRVRGARVVADGDRARGPRRMRRERGGRLGRRRARARRGCAPELDPPGQGRPRHAARGRRSATTSPRSSRCARTGGPCSSSRGATSPTSARPTPTTTARSTTRSATRPTSSTCWRTLNGVLEEPVTKDDVVGTWAGLRPLLRTASSARTADLSRRHGVRVSESGVVTITGGKLTTYRRMAVRHRRRRSSDGLGTSAPGAGRSSCPCSAGDGLRRPAAPGNEPSLHEHLAGRYGTEARGRARARRPPTPRSANPSCRDCRTCGRRPSTRRATRWRARVDDVLSRRTRARLLGPRRVGGRGDRRSRGCWRPSSAGTRRRSSARCASYRRARRGRARPRRTRRAPAHVAEAPMPGGPMPDVSEEGRPTPPIAFGTDRGRRDVARLAPRVRRRRRRRR